MQVVECVVDALATAVDHARYWTSVGCVSDAWAATSPRQCVSDALAAASLQVCNALTCHSL